MSREARRSAERLAEIRLEAQRDELEAFLHAYLMDNEPQVTPRGLADAVLHWLYRQEADSRGDEADGT